MWKEQLRYSIAWLGIRVFLFNIVIGGTGIFLIFYETLAHISSTFRVDVLEKIASPVSAFVTFLVVTLTACSIYFEPAKPTRPDPASKWLVAPIVIAGCIFGLLVLFTKGSVPDHIVNGFALLGLAGALFRIQPNPQRAADTF